jgi:heme exporter protein CcmB
MAVYIRNVWCLVRKDMRREWRARMTWPAVVLLGFLLMLTLELQTDFPREIKHQFVGCLLWLAVFFAGALGLEQSFADEHENGCWDALRMYPVSPASIYLAKLIINFGALTCVAAVLIPLLAALAGAPLLERPLVMLMVTLLANLGLAAIGTLTGAVVHGVGRRGNLLVLVVLPLTLPVLLGAGEATRLMIAGSLGTEFWRWVQLLAAFAVMFVTASVMVFDFVMQE